MTERLKPTEAEMEASRWLVRLKSSDATLDDHRRFRAWLDADAAHRAAFEEIGNTWTRLDTLKHLPREARARFSRGRLALACAAVAAAAVLALIILRADDSAPAYASDVGEIESVTLPDGSTAELSAATEIKAAFDARTRRVRLDDGEALFVVRADPARPFVVVTPFGEARARGTTFVVRVGADAMRTTVLEGAVEGVPRDPNLFRRITGGRSQASPVLAHASQEFVLDGERGRATALSAQVARRRLAWREGMLAFDGEPLSEAAREVTRHTGARFEFEDSELGRTRVGGYIRANDVDGFLRLLRENFQIAGDTVAKRRVRLRQIE